MKKGEDPLIDMLVSFNKIVWGGLICALIGIAVVSFIV